MSGVETRVDGLEAVFAPKVLAELDLNGQAFRRLVAGGGCLFGGQFKAAGCQGYGGVTSGLNHSTRGG